MGHEDKNDTLDIFELHYAFYFHERKEIYELCKCLLNSTDPIKIDARHKYRSQSPFWGGEMIK